MKIPIWVRRWNKKIHIYLGLYMLLFLWLFSISGLFINHHNWFERPPQPVQVGEADRAAAGGGRPGQGRGPEGPAGSLRGDSPVQGQPKASSRSFHFYPGGSRQGDVRGCRSGEVCCNHPVQGPDGPLSDFSPDHREPACVERSSRDLAGAPSQDERLVGRAAVELFHGRCLGGIHGYGRNFDLHVVSASQDLAGGLDRVRGGTPQLLLFHLGNQVADLMANTSLPLPVVAVPGSEF